MVSQTSAPECLHAVLVRISVILNHRLGCLCCYQMNVLYYMPADSFKGVYLSDYDETMFTNLPTVH